MKTQTHQRAISLVIAIALIAADVSILRGERSPDDKSADTQAVNTQPAADSNSAPNSLPLNFLAPKSKPLVKPSEIYSPRSNAGRASLNQRSSRPVEHAKANTRDSTQVDDVKRISASRPESADDIKERSGDRFGDHGKSRIRSETGGRLRGRESWNYPRRR